MPWKESSVMEERLRFVARLLDGEGMSEVCRSFGISRKTGYKIFKRYKEEAINRRVGRDVSRKKVDKHFAIEVTDDERANDRAAEAGEAPLGRAQDPRAAGLECLRSFGLFGLWQLWQSSGPGGRVHFMIAEKSSDVKVQRVSRPAATLSSMNSTPKGLTRPSTCNAPASSTPPLRGPIAACRNWPTPSTTRRFS